MNTAEQNSVPSKSDEEKPRFVVGAKQNPDGTLDYSSAAEMLDPEGKLAKGFEEAKIREQKARAKRLEIPEDIKPGSADMAWYTMKNTIFMNEEVANKARQEGKPDARREALINAQKMQQNMFDNASMSFSQALIKEGLETGESVTAEQAREKAGQLTANEMCDIVQKYLVDHYESLQNKGNKDAYLQEGNSGGNYPIKALLKATQNLQSRLIDEATKGGTK